MLEKLVLKCYSHSAENSLVFLNQHHLFLFAMFNSTQSDRWTNRQTQKQTRRKVERRQTERRQTEIKKNRKKKNTEKKN